ncbi:MAG: hypothetical protein KAV87_24035 [Desulfobacteraceae bacterium]|nr:hypothetical protein [Desulfobacteraceae bacterium]
MSKWNPGDDYVIRFSDESGEPRTDEQINAMIEDMRKIANFKGFDLCSHGSGVAFKKSTISDVLANIDLNEIIKNV